MSATDPRVGTTLGGYEIDSLLGRGGMGVVYLARDVKFGRSVALKVLAPDLAQDETFRARFVRESQMAAATDHPNIIPVYDTGESDGVLFLAMRYVQGTDLGEVIKAHGPMEIGRAVSIVAQIGSALDAAHERGLIHRDVKPANVLLTTLGSDDQAVDHVYLTDFGLTKRSDSRSQLTGTGGFMGTIDYMAPEQIEGKEVDNRTDLYALGCVLYECLTGVVPYERDSDVAVMYAHLMDERPSVSALRPEIPEEIDQVVARAMSRESADRYSHSTLMVSEARRALGLSGPQAMDRRVDAASIENAPTPKPSRRGKRTLFAAAAAALGLLAVTGYALTRPEEAQRDVAKPAVEPSEAVTSASIWQPNGDNTLQLQLSGKIDTSYGADIYYLDMYETSTQLIDDLQADGRRVVCYLSAGAWEDYRPDADEFPVGLLGKNLEGSTEEKWLDVRELDVLRPLLSARITECAEKGFDGIGFDNVDGYANDSGFKLTEDDQRNFNGMLAEIAHEKGLTAGFTNAPTLAPGLEPEFEFVIATGCYQFDECHFFENYAQAGKPVFVIEFKSGDFCALAEADGYIAQLKKFNLGAGREACWE